MLKPEILQMQHGEMVQGARRVDHPCGRRRK